MKPRLTFRVPNRLANDDSQIGVELEFKHMDDFGPEAVAQQVEPIRKLVEARQRLESSWRSRSTAATSSKSCCRTWCRTPRRCKQISAAAGRRPTSPRAGGQEVMAEQKPRSPPREPAEVEDRAPACSIRIVDNFTPRRRTARLREGRHRATSSSRSSTARSSTPKTPSRWSKRASRRSTR